MQSLTIDIAIAYVWLALSVAAILAGLFAEFRNTGRWAWAVVVGGICLLGWSVYHIHPTLTLARLGSDIPQLQQEVAFRGREIARLQQAEKAAWDAVLAERALNAELRARLDALEKAAHSDREQYEQRLARVNVELVSERSLHAETKRLLEIAERDRADLNRRLVELSVELTAEKARHAETSGRLDAAERAAHSDREQYEQQLARANAELVREKSFHAETKRLLEATQRDLDDRNRRLVELDMELAVEKARHVETKRLLEAAQGDLDDRNRRLVELDMELAAEKARHAETKKLLADAQQHGPASQLKGFAGELYSAVLLNETELVAGKKGTYHVLRLVSPTKETIPIFDLGSYRLDTTRQQEVAKATAEFNRDVVSVLGANRPVAILIRGHANNVSFRGPGALVPGPCSSNSISYLPYDESTKKYASTAIQQVLASTYTNQELPNLRAGFVACIARASIQSVELLILQGQISETTDRSAQTTEMFLFAGEAVKAISP